MALIEEMDPEAEPLPRSEVEALKVEVLTGRRFALCGVRNAVRAIVRIKTPVDESGVQHRLPISVACVLDTSGSMAGEELRFAKRACMKLVKHLEVSDIFHFITYSDKVKTIIEDGDLSYEGKDSLRSRINDVRAGGRTNLFGGLERAASLLGCRTAGGHQSEADNEIPRITRRVFLFSDGCVNEGETNHEKIRRRVAEWAAEGITTTTFGIGADFDEPLMRGIAEDGKGRYTFLATAGDIPRLVSKSVHDLLKLYGSEASLDVRGGSHTRVSRMYGERDEDNEDGDGAVVEGILDLGDLHDANERVVLLELESSPSGDIVGGSSFRAAEWILNFQRNGAQVQFSGHVDLVATHERAQIETESSTVCAMFAIRQSSDFEITIAEHLNHGNRPLAMQVKKKQLALLTAALETAKTDPTIDPVHVATLERVLQRAQHLAELLEGGLDTEMVRRHCVQESCLTRAMSFAGFSNGCDSSASSARSSASMNSSSSFPHRFVASSRLSDDGSLYSADGDSSYDS
eukprot:TRINITY_DN76543_c0_g1_i1.p1 TRINITY_DN76543_c0_g1~~TRINITY_DN76543_c0_g1_i1.p1  ORF type:complete len:518 (-),score=80.48 TRINITY_DN76543_c0_g1_i1:34-1587(-)